MDAAARLVDAASELMHQRGYEAVGVQELCDHAGVKKGSFYHWFPSKAALAVAMLTSSWERTRRHLFEPAFAPDVAPLERFDRYAASLVAHNRQLRDRNGSMLGCRFGNLAAELSTRDPAVRAMVSEVFAEMGGYFRAAITDAMSAGDIPPLDAEQASVAVLALMEGLLLLGKAANEPDLIARFSHDVRALLGVPPRPFPSADEHGAHR